MPACTPVFFIPSVAASFTACTTSVGVNPFAICNNGAKRISA
jgi:hypothetical protein